METIGNKNIEYQFLGEHPIVRTYKGDELINEYKPLYNPPSDWKDIRSDCPENSIALYAAHSRINNPNYTIEKVTGPVKYTVVGNPTIENGVASGFSSSDYLTLTNNIDFNNNFEIIIKCKPGNFSSAQHLISWLSNGYGCGIQFLTNGKIAVLVGYENLRAFIDGVHTYGENEDVYIKLIREDRNLSLYYSLDGNNYILDASESISSSMQPIQLPNYIRIGVNASYNVSNIFNGSIDLNETYIKVNNQMWFGSQMQLTSANPNIYLQSSGTQYIDTGIIPTELYTYSFAYSTSSTSNQVLFGQRTSGNVSTSTDQVDCSVMTDGEAKQGMVFGLDRTEISCSLNTKYTLTYADTRTNLAATNSIYLGCFNLLGSTAAFFSGKIYKLVISNNNIPIINLVPVPQGLVIGNFIVPSNGMFDIVEQKFYGNLGTGDFTYGNDSPETITYDNLGFMATCVGGYKVFIDGNQYGSTYASGSQCNIIWSQSGINTGDDITTPNALKAHKIWISPATSGNNITEFKCQRVASSGTEEQGVLWAHFNLSNEININNLFNDNAYKNTQVVSVTGKNDKILIYRFFSKPFALCSNLEYVPQFVGDGGVSNYNFQGAFQECQKLKEIRLSNIKITLLHNTFMRCHLLERIKTKNVTVIPGYSLFYTYFECFNLQETLPIQFTNSVISMQGFLTEDTKLKDTVLDTRGTTTLTKVDSYGSNTRFMSGFKGLRVSNEAPFNDSTSPQINVPYTGMDRTALVQLFEDLPYNVGYTVIGSPTITNGIMTNLSNSNYLKLDSNLTYNGNSNLKFYSRFKTPTTFDTGGTGSMFISISTSYSVGSPYKRRLMGVVAITGLNYPTANVGYGVSDGTVEFYTYNVQPDTWYRQEFIANNGTWTMNLYDDSGNLLGSANKQLSFEDITREVFIGGCQYQEEGSVLQAIDLNNTYIEKDGIPWFRGQPTMTKTINVVGCTGTSSLTANDRAIVTDKGWSITYQ